MTAPVNNVTAPCVGCGMCCTGVLYGRAEVQPGEEPALAAAGLRLMPDEEKTYFRLPCHHESGGRCTIYENRFTICRTFRCALLRDYQAGAIGSDEAKEKVRTSLDLVRQVMASDPEAKLFVARTALRRQLAVEVTTARGEERAAIGRRLLAMTALDAFLERWFRNKKMGAKAG